METTASPILSLPPELRNEIYGYALMATNEIVKISTEGDDYHPALLRTCKQIRNEARPLWYATAEFRAIVDSDNASGPFNWISRVHPKDQKLIKSFCFEWSVSPAEERIFRAVGPRSTVEQLRSYRSKMFNRGKGSVQHLEPSLVALRHAGVDAKYIPVERAVYGWDGCADARRRLLEDYQHELDTLVAKVFSH